jgi:trehalose/maltose transport system substrate-binding protein
MTKPFKLALAAAFAAATGIFALAAQSGIAAADTVSMFCSSSGSEYELCKNAAEAWAKESGNQVKINKMPASWDDALPLYQQLLAAKSSDIDVLLVDVVWVGMLQKNLLDLNGEVPADEIKAHFPSALAAGSVDGKLVAMPWYNDTGLLFYRKDLLEKYGKPVPKTYAELVATAQDIQDSERKAGNGDMWGYAWQGKAYEGLSCDAIEWVASYGGGTIVDEKGNITIDNPKAAAALTEAASWVNKISPQGVLSYDEESSRGTFEAGNAVFLRNWSYVWGTSQTAGGKLVGKVGVTALPVGAEGEKSSGCAGTAHISVSKYTKHKAAAVSLVRYLTGAAEQKRRVVEAAYNPTLAPLYQDPDVLKAIPFLQDAIKGFGESVARPSSVTGSSYNKVSQAFYTEVHAVLAGEKTADVALKDLAAELAKIKKKSKW